LFIRRRQITCYMYKYMQFPLSHMFLSWISWSYIFYILYIIIGTWKRRKRGPRCRSWPAWEKYGTNLGRITFRDVCIYGCILWCVTLIFCCCWGVSEFEDDWFMVKTASNAASNVNHTLFLYQVKGLKGISF